MIRIRRSKGDVDPLGGKKKNNKDYIVWKCTNKECKYTCTVITKRTEDDEDGILPGHCPWNGLRTDWEQIGTNGDKVMKNFTNMKEIPVRAYPAFPEAVIRPTPPPTFSATFSSNDENIAPRDPVTLTPNGRVIADPREEDPIGIATGPVVSGSVQVRIQGNLLSGPSLRRTFDVEFDTSREVSMGTTVSGSSFISQYSV